MSKENRLEGLRQELLEFYFDCHPDPAGMEQRLADDAELSTLYEEVKQTASLLENAAVSESPQLDLVPPDGTKEPGPDLPPTIVHRGWSFKKSWYAAAGLIAIAITPAAGNWAYRAWQQHELETGKVRLLLSAPPANPDGSPLRFHVETHNLAQEKMVAQVDWKVLDDKGDTLTESTTVCTGTTDITVAGHLNKPRKLVVTARVPGADFEQTVEQVIHPAKSAPLVHVTSDKPAYRPGEAVLLRLACLDRLTLRGADRIGLRCRIVDPKGTPTDKRALGVGKGVTAWTWKVPPSAMGGKYALEVRDQADEFTLERHEFLVRNFQPPKLKKKIVLDRQTYAAGETGAADLQVTRATGGPAAGAKVRASLLVDGDESWHEEGVLDADGRAVFQFDVPGGVIKGAGRFVARITDGGNVETELEPFVIPTDKIDIAFYPEGGELVLGCENRIYAQARDGLGRPLSARGKVFDDQGKFVAQFKTMHMGRTVFRFPTERGRSYKLVLTSPKEQTFELPKVQETGVALQPTNLFFAAGAPAECEVFTAGKGPWIAAVFCRGVLVGQRSILKKGKSKVSIPLVDEASGVLRVTVFDQKMRPVAERLVQRDAKRTLTVAMTPESLRATPGSKQKVTVKTTDETGEPVSCIVGLTVTDRAVADMLDFVRTGLHDQRQLFTDVEKPDDKVEEFLSDARHHRRNVDFLLGCLGWRRYVWRGDVDKDALIAAGGEWAKALPSREGRSWAPLVTDTLASHQAEIMNANWSRTEAKRWVYGLSVLGFIVFGLLGLVHGVAAVGRRWDWRPRIVVQCTVALMIAVTLFSTVVTHQVTHLSDAAAPTASMATGWVDDLASFVMPAKNFDFEGGRTNLEYLGDDTSLSLFFDDRALRESSAESFFVRRFAATDESERPTDFFGSYYVKDFDVEVAQGAVILDELLDFASANPTGLATSGFDLFTVGALTGNSRFSAGLEGIRLRDGWAFGLGLVPGSGGGGGRYRGPGDVIPPGGELAWRAVDKLVAAFDRAQTVTYELRTADTAAEGRLAELQKTLRENNALLDMVNRRYPGIFETLHPLVTGTVGRVTSGSDMLTVKLQTGKEHLGVGARFAIYNTSTGYKGEATVTKIDNDRRFCYARVTLRQGEEIALDDLASTNLSANVASPGKPKPITLTPAERRRMEFVLANPQLASTVFRYSHEASTSRGNFVETLFWQPYLLTDEKGEATVEFDVNDSVTTWKIYADAHGNGRVGQGEAEFESFLPFSIDPKVPTHVSEGDVLELPVSIVADDQSVKQAIVELQTGGPLSMQSPGQQTIRLRDGRGRALAKVRVGEPQAQGSTGSVTIRGNVEKARDTVGRQFVIQPRGFPHLIDHAGKLKGKETFELVVPDDLAKRTAELTLRFYPSPLANLEEALQGMLREPSGCFEQVSSSNYPNVMVLSLLEASGDNIPAAAAKAQQMLDRGYKKLTGYEVAGGGFEWWGKSPAHAALTAYGLMQFTDMSRVYDVDAAMVARTRTWLLDRRDGNGGFRTGQGRYGHFMGGSKQARSAYIAYSLLYAGEKADTLRKEIDFLERRIKTTDNLYELAVIACALAEADRPSAGEARNRLFEAQEKDGSLTGTGTITGSGGKDLTVETTSFAVLAWLSAADMDEETKRRSDSAVQRAVRFLEKQRQGGGHFGGTQATVMALKAVTAYLGANTPSVKPGVIKVTLGGEEIARRELFGSEKRTITIEHLGPKLAIGKNDLGIELTGGNEFPFSLEFAYRADEPVSAENCRVDLDTWLTKSVLTEGDTTALHAVVKNKTAKAVASPMILVGLPAGLHVDSRILDDLKKAETIAAWELTDQTIVLYLRGLASKETRDIVIDLTGRIPGTTKGPASRAYLYYEARQKKWTPPIEVTVTASR